MHKDRISGIYKIENYVNGKFYVGSSCNIKNRFSIHYRELCLGIHSNPKLQASWSKYGAGNFYFSTIELCDTDTLVEREQYYIDNLNPFFNIARDVGYPATPRAGTIEAMVRSEKNMEARRNSEWCNSDEFHEMLSDVMVERWKNSDYREMRSTNTRDLWKDDDYKEKQKQAHRKINSSEREYIRKLKEMGYKIRDLSARFNVSQTTIGRILQGLH